MGRVTAGIKAVAIAGVVAAGILLSLALVLAVIVVLAFL